MLRNQLNTAMKEAMKAGDKEKLLTIRLILANIKQKDIDGRTSGGQDSLSDTQILQLLQTMVKQRKESIQMFEKAGRDDLVQKETTEIQVIESFLPKQMDEGAIKSAIQTLIDDLKVTSPKDMGKVMAALKDQYAGQMDFGKASQMVKQLLT
ncbi:MAG: GatB/YqeY domain-containing protein [Holosporaceae bacterium]|nr:MAG: GatB/YqeY domain-containing protein [Holosporaceae bacterium]